MATPGTSPQSDVILQPSPFVCNSLTSSTKRNTVPLEHEQKQTFLLRQGEPCLSFARGSQEPLKKNCSLLLRVYSNKDFFSAFLQFSTVVRGMQAGNSGMYIPCIFTMASLSPRFFFMFKAMSVHYSTIKHPPTLPNLFNWKIKCK